MRICCLYATHSNRNIYQFGHLLTMFLLLVVAAHLSSTCLALGILSHIIMKWSLILIDNKKAIIQQLDENTWNFHGKNIIIIIMGATMRQNATSSDVNSAIPCQAAAKHVQFKPKIKMLFFSRDGIQNDHDSVDDWIKLNGAAGAWSWEE